MRNNAVPRKDLQKILLVNWSRFTAETIKVSNSVLITGVNGTGKSTVLDAVSYAVSGNRDFNSAAQDRDRSVRSYVRGDTKSSGARRFLRSGAVVSYIALEFWSAQENAHFVAGVCVESKDELSDEVFRFFVCTVCPVKDATSALRYFSEERAFHGTSTGQTVAAPALGFLFPAFDDRRANIYDALYYSHDTAEIHPELIDGLFRVAPPMSAAEQKETFSETLAAALDTDCRFDVVQAVHENLRSRIEEHKEAKDPDALEITARDVVSVLRTSGVPLEKTEKFERECEKRYGTHAALDPNNIVESKKLEIVTPEVKITLPGEFGYLVETREIDGRKYILIPADGGVEVNGIGVNLADAKKE